MSGVLGTTFLWRGTMRFDAPTTAKAWSLHRRLIALLLAIVSLATVVQALLLYRSVLIEADRLFDYQMQQMAAALEGTRGAPRIGQAEPPGELEDFAFVVNI